MQLSEKIGFLGRYRRNKKFHYIRIIYLVHSKILLRLLSESIINNNRGNSHDNFQRISANFT